MLPRRQVEPGVILFDILKFVRKEAVLFGPRNSPFRIEKRRFLTQKAPLLLLVNYNRLEINKLRFVVVLLRILLTF